VGAAIAHSPHPKARARKPQERREKMTAEQGITRCRCGWTFAGSMAEGVIRVRDHRREAHPDLPERSPRVGRKKRPAEAEGTRSRRVKNRNAVLRAVEQIGPRRATSAEVADLSGVSRPEVGRVLSSEGFRRLKNGRAASWWLDRDNPPRSPAPAAGPTSERQCLEAAVARLRESGRSEVGVAEIAAEAGMNSISVGKFLAAAGYRRVAEATWDVSGESGGDRSPQDD
jgi:DNA-binding phage protein